MSDPRVLASAEIVVTDDGIAVDVWVDEDFGDEELAGQLIEEAGRSLRSSSEESPGWGRP